MSLAYRVLFAVVCKNTHHRLAFDALRLLTGPQAAAWRDLFLSEYEAYLQGSKAPDDEFKDFQNHVLHVRENYWGGAVKTAQLWYKLTVQALQNGDWRGAVYSAGVLTHYVTDPCMPLHTGQTEAEGKIHRAVEWSIAKSYVELQNIIEQDLGGYPHFEVDDSPTWLADLIRHEADEANRHYQTILDHYDLAVGVKSPERGMDQELKDAMARQISRAAAATAVVLDRAIVEAKTPPPLRTPSVQAFLAAGMTPIYTVTKAITDTNDRAAVKAIYDELQTTGKVSASLAEDDRIVRRMHADQVLRIPLAMVEAERPKPTGTKHGQGAAARSRSNRAPILLGLPSVPRLRMPRITRPKIAMPSLKMRMPAMPKMAVPKMSMPKLSMPKMAMPKLGVPKLSLSKLKMPKLSWKKQKSEVVVEENGSQVKTTAVDSPPRPLRRTDLEMPASSSLLRRSDPPAKQPPPPTESRREGELRFHLDRNDKIEDAPSIGPKKARRLEGIGIRTVADLLRCEPVQVARQMNSQHITPVTVRRWQAEATLVCRVPNLRGHDAQLLVAAGIDEVEMLSISKADALLQEVDQFIDTPEGERILRGNSRPDRKEVADWIAWARQARKLQTA